MNLKNKRFEQKYYLLGLLLSCMFVCACTNKIADIAIKNKARITLESVAAKPSAQYITSHLVNEDLNSLEPQIAKDANGNEMAVWEEYDGTRFGIWAKRRAATAKQDGSVVGIWERSTPIDALIKGNAYHPQIQFDANGNAIAVWEQSDGLTSSIWTNSYTVSKGWGIPNRVNTHVEGSAKKPQIAITPNNLPIVIWQQSSARNPGYFRIFATQQNADLAWSAPLLIDADQGNSSSPSIASDTNGNVIAIWHTFDGAQQN